MRVPLETIAAARAGDPRAQEDLIGAYEQGVARFVTLHVGAGTHCEDLCQTVFVKMFLGLKTLKSDEVFEGWLLRIARNVCTDHLRQRQGWRRLFVAFGVQHEAVSAPESEPPAASPLAAPGALDGLSAVDRKLLALSLAGDKSYEDMARETALSSSAVKSRLFRVRQTLKHTVKRTIDERGGE